MINPKKTNWGTMLKVIVVALLVGAGGGVLSAALTMDYLSGYAIKLGNLTLPLQLSGEREYVRLETEEAVLKNIRERVLPAVVGFYDRDARVFAVVDALAHGVALTSDGWVLALSEGKNTSRWNAVIGNEVFEPKERVLDQTTGVTFFKLPLQHLTTLSFGDTFRIEAGESVFVLAKRAHVVPTHVTAVQWNNPEKSSSEDPIRRFVLSTALPAESVGAPVINGSGELIGIVASVGDESSVLPLDVIRPAFESYLRTETITRPTLGVVVMDLSRSVGVPEETKRGYVAGALILPNGVVRGSAASKAGLKAGDIILSVHGKQIDQTHTLNDLLFEFEAGDQIQLHINRNGEENAVSVVL